MTTTTLPDRLPLLGLDGIVLRHGNHGRREDGVCALEAAAWLAGLPHSDAPSCVCPVIRSFVIAWNDAIPDDARRTALLKPFLLKILNTASTRDVELKRSYLAFDWLVRVQTPAWLDLTPALREHAAALRALTEIADQQTIDAASPKVAAAWAAAGDAAGAAAWAAAGAAAWAAAGVAAGDAAWDAAGAAARDAAWDAAGAAARDAAGAAARAAAGAAARAAARAAAGAAARAAAGAALQPTVEQLQASAADLLTRMIAVQA